MITKREIHGGMWTEVKQVQTAPNGEKFVKVSTCCCSSPGGTRRECMESRNLKHPCRCHCHSTVPHKQDYEYLSR